MLIYFFSLLLVFTLIYILLIRRIISGWDSTPVSNYPLPSPVQVSVIIPARNEERNIIKTLQRLSGQNYPKNLIEIIVVDDHSEDNTVALVKSHFPEIKIISNSSSETGKKPSLEKGISYASGPIIITLDADCFPESDEWLSIMVSSLINNGHQALTGPVKYISDSSVWQNFQATEILGLMLTTASAYKRNWFQLCNGANMIFYKSVFEEVGGYRGNESFASGDDMFLFQKLEEKYAGKTGFIKNKNTVVLTRPAISLSSYINQRIRWGTKNKVLKSVLLKQVLGFVFAYNSLLVIGLLFSPFIKTNSIVILLFCWLIKLIVDYIMLMRSADFFNSKATLRSYVLSGLLYPVMLFITGFGSLFKKSYNWKGRKME